MASDRLTWILCFTHHGVLCSELRGRQHPFKGTIVPDYGDLMLTKSTGIKNICRGKLGF